MVREMDLYGLLEERAKQAPAAFADEVLLGLSWTLARVGAEVGLCFAPGSAPRTLEFPGTLRGRPAVELAAWLRSDDPHQAAVGGAVTNALIQSTSSCVAAAQLLQEPAPQHLQVFAHFRKRCEGSRIVVIGKYPGLDELWADVPYDCIERRNYSDVQPESAAEHLLPRADWVFLTGSSISNKTLPKLLALSAGAQVVLMGPSVPWLREFADFGVDYLAGVCATSAERLSDVVGEGGGTQIFATGAVRYHALALR